MKLKDPFATLIIRLLARKIEKSRTPFKTKIRNNFPNNKPIFLKIISYGRYCDFSHHNDSNNWITRVPKADGVNLSTRKAGRFPGTCNVLYATSNY